MQLLMSDVSSEGTQADSYVIDCWLFQMLASYTVSAHTGYA